MSLVLTYDRPLEKHIEISVTSVLQTSSPSPKLQLCVCFTPSVKVVLRYDSIILKYYLLLN
jgi:hypothetical protein